ncbi:MAG: DUF1028 domain-containing protein [Saprospiraceae bacterium]|nr:DUF1028 domain-containing protein [Saprospiraceae bacterium]
MKLFLTLFIPLIFISATLAQDTFSMVAVDPETGAVGSAGASCVDLTTLPYEADFLGQLFPGLGAINTQAWYLSGNQANAKTRMEAGDTPSEIIDWLINNDIQNDSTKRQYGVVAFVNGLPEAAAHTGSNTDDWKGHRVGDNYSIQGNILLGDFIVDAMESNFINTPSSFPEKMMAAMQGANVIGADSRCTDNGSSALFAFLKIAQPDDVFGSPSLVLGVITADGAGIEPIDSLQTLFNDWFGTSTFTTGTEPQKLRMFPNPASSSLQVEIPFEGVVDISIFDSSGKLMNRLQGSGNKEIAVQDLPSGSFVLKIQDKLGRISLGRFVKD